MTYDTAFEDWANLVNDFASHSITSLGEFRKNITLDVFNEAGVKALSYNLYRCWVSEYQAVPDLDAGANAVAITTIKLEYEWFERDTSVSESQGPARSRRVRRMAPARVLETASSCQAVGCWTRPRRLSRRGRRAPHGIRGRMAGDDRGLPQARTR